MTRMELHDEVIAILSDKLGVQKDRVVPTANLIDDLGADSLDQVEILMAFEDRFDIDIPDEDADKLLTPALVEEYLANRINAI